MSIGRYLVMALAATVTAYPFASLSASLAAGNATCPADSPLSCSLDTPPSDLCCYNSPGGLLLQTQFWDTDPATGPDDSWTIHGLWPDNCDGTYQANCDKAREYTDIQSTLSDQAPDVLDYMNTYWKDYQGQDETFWEHEWGKHGTCISTLDTQCYENYQERQEMVDFFTKTVELFKGLDTYKTLSDAGITPSEDQTYALADIENALTSAFGNKPYLGCKNGALNEMWYFYNVQGSVQSGQFVPTDSVTKTTCPSKGIKYLPKNGGGGGDGNSTDSDVSRH